MIRLAPVICQPAGAERPVPWRCKAFPAPELEAEPWSSRDGTGGGIRACGTWEGVEACRRIAAKLPRLLAASPGRCADVPRLISERERVQVPGSQPGGGDEAQSYAGGRWRLRALACVRLIAVFAP